MLKKLLFTVGLIFAVNTLVFAQSGTLKGKIIDKGTNEPIAFANIIIESGGKQMGGTTSDFDGNYTIKPITPGKYDLKATYVGYKPLLIRGVIINANKITFQDISMESTVVQIETFEVTDYKVPLIDKDKTSTGGTVTSEEIEKMPNRSASAVATTVGGVFSADGERGSVRGQRTEGTIMYIDGVRVRGSSSLPQAAIEEVSVITGGLPARYGDATGGVINVTTKGPSRIFGGGVELQTSQFLDAFGYNRVGLNATGPLLSSKKDPLNTISLLGFFVAGDFIYNKDGRPTANGIYKAKDEVIDQLNAVPLLPSGTGSGSVQSAEFLRESDLELVKSTQNTSNYSVNLSGKIDVRTSPTINLSFGGSYNYFKGNNYSYANSLLNYDNNSESSSATWRVFGKFTQRFPTAKESKSIVKNVYYTIDVNYSMVHNKTQDPTHEDRLFNYGYLGKFTTYKAKNYEYGIDTVYDPNKEFWLLTGYIDTLYDFQRAEINPELANYTSLYYSLYDNPANYMNSTLVQLGGGLLNGEGPNSVYGLYSNIGSQYNGYNEGEFSQIAINANGSADIGNHEIQFGIQYEQRSDRSYGYAPVGLWTIMRGLTNFHIEQLDKDNPIRIVNDQGVAMDTIVYNRKFDGPSQRVFDLSLRTSLGLDPSGTDWIDIDSYDPDSYTINYYDENGVMKTAHLDGDLEIDMFSADELLNDGNSLIAYYGYDYKGNKLKSKPSFEDFFYKTDENGVFTRDRGAFEPIYTAAYIQDKFAFKDLIFNLGVRVDRFDANQMVLKDPYLLYASKTVKEVNDLGQHPENMGDDYIVYVDRQNNPTVIKGYRNESTWYNSEGAEIVDPSVLDAGNGVTPYLVDPSQEVITPDVFEDYKPQVSVMPRISFSFPISDEALFFAHYDVLTQRPTGRVQLDITDFYFIESKTSDNNFPFNNPNLKPTKTVDYELGFMQKLSNTSSLNFSAFYRDMKDQIQVYRFSGAYPRSYYSYNNIDFGTVKGLTVAYDLRRTNNARIRAAYTLQFANGTGSNDETAKNLVTSGQPNLRTVNPLDYDRRHAFNIVLDYRFSRGKKYNGPKINKRIKGTDKVKTIELLSNTGFSLTVNGGSGTPYSRSSRVGVNQLQGSVNGSRLPWQFRLDMRIDKDIMLTMGKDKENARDTYLNIYFQILNLLNTKNILRVYRYTGNPDDDGYLAAAEFQAEIEAQTDAQSYRDLYAIYINNPSNYSLPRRVRFGVILNF